jgi:hypothetical protein
LLIKWKSINFRRRIMSFMCDIMDKHQQLMANQVSPTLSSTSSATI